MPLDFSKEVLEFDPGGYIELTSKIHKDHLSKLFDPFVISEPPGKGTGLGLSLTYYRMSEQDGRVLAENKENGVELTIMLPLS